jgi:type VI secretion system secreted protein VgrG
MSEGLPMSFRPMDGGSKAPGIGVEASVKVPEVKVSGALGADISAAGGLPDLAQATQGIAGNALAGVVPGATPGIISSGAGPNLGQAVGTLTGAALGNIGGAAGGTLGTIATGIAGGQLPDVRGIAGGIAGGAIGNAVTGFAGGAIGGAVGDIAGNALGGVSNLGTAIEGIAAGAIGGAVGGIVDKAVTGAVGKVAGEFVGNIAGDLAGGLAGAISGGAIQATLDGLLGGSSAKLEAAAELPVFADIAVTAADPKKLIKSAAAKAEGALGRIVKDGARKLADKNFEVSIGSGDKLDVRQFSIHERLSSLFQVNLVVVSDNSSIEFDDVVGQPAKFSMSAGMHDKFWSGVCNHFEQVRHEPGGLSTYSFTGSHVDDMQGDR